MTDGKRDFPEALGGQLTQENIENGIFANGPFRQIHNRLEIVSSGRRQQVVLFGGVALSERELTVLKYLATRLTTREIAAELYVSMNTLRTHTKSIYRKLGVESRAEAAAAARTAGIL